MTASEIAETLINGNISDARNAILNANALPHLAQPAASAVLALDVVKVMYVEHGIDLLEAVTRVQRCVKGIHPDYHGPRTKCDCDPAADALVALGCNDPREMEDD